MKDSSVVCFGFRKLGDFFFGWRLVVEIDGEIGKYIYYGNCYYNGGVRKVVGVRRRGICVNFVGGVLGRVF